MKLQYKKYMIFLLGIAILTLGVSMTVKSDIGAGSCINNNSVYKKRIYKNNNIYNICYNGIVYRCVG